MSIMLNSKERLENIWQEVVELRKESDNIKTTFSDKEVDISDYMSKSMINLIFSDIFTIIFGVIFAGIVFAGASMIGLGWLVGIVYGLALLGLLFMFFVPIAVISGVFGYLVYFDGTPIDEAAYLCVGLFVLYRITTVFNRKQKAIIVKNNNVKEERLASEVNKILDEELVPIAHEKYIVSLDTLMNEADIDFLPESIVNHTFNKKTKVGDFEKISSFNPTAKESNTIKKSKIFKSLLNNQPSSEHVEIIELEIS